MLQVVFTYFMFFATLTVFYFQFDFVELSRSLRSLGERCGKKYRDFRNLNSLVSTQYKTVGMIMWISFVMICKMYWLQFLQWINRSVVYSHDKKHLVFNYVLNGKVYKLVVSPVRGPQKVLVVSNESGEDVSDEILPFMGVEENWHRRIFTPSFWGYTQLTFEMTNGETMTFEAQDEINI